MRCRLRSARADCAIAAVSARSRLISRAELARFLYVGGLATVQQRRLGAGHQYWSVPQPRARTMGPMAHPKTAQPKTDSADRRPRRQRTRLRVVMPLVIGLAALAACSDSKDTRQGQQQQPARVGSLQRHVERCIERGVERTDRCRFRRELRAGVERAGRRRRSDHRQVHPQGRLHPRPAVQHRRPGLTGGGRGVVQQPQLDRRVHRPEHRLEGRQHHARGHHGAGRCDRTARGPGPRQGLADRQRSPLFLTVSDTV